MNQKKYFDYIEERLTTLATRIKLRGQLNILDLNIHSEDFYCRFLNLLYEYKRLTNLNNSEKQNIEAIDLIDTEKKIYIQVSATASKQKKELMDDKQLVKIANLANNKNIQFIASILQDKLPEELNRDEYIILKLSEDDKLFKIENQEINQ